MAAKSKKRLSKIENKLLKLEKLELKDVFCSICQSILIEPVTLPCFHDFCQRCFNGSIENNALCCPLCRLRIGSWLRTATKQKNLVNVELWNFIQSKFPQEIEIKSKGEDLHLPEEAPLPRISEPGEIRSEYEAELRRLRAERLRLEQRHIQETELLIKQIHQEEEEAQKKYLEGLKRDEILAEQIHQELEAPPLPNTPKKNSNVTVAKAKLKTTRIDSYLTKIQPATTKDSSLITDDNAGTNGSAPRSQPVKAVNGGSPEMVPSYGKLIKSFIDKKIKNAPSLWNKENGDKVKEKKEDSPTQTEKGIAGIEDKVKVKGAAPSLLVSLPYTGILQHKINATENRNVETGSVDSMRQELCYFKPIEGTSPTGFTTSKGLPIRVPGLRVEKQVTSPSCEVAPSRAQYLDGLCQLRNLSLATNLPSAFVIAINILNVKKNTPTKCEATRSKIKKSASPGPCVTPSLPIKKNANRNKQTINIDGITKLNNETNLRPSRSMGNLSKDENETTPKKGKMRQRKVLSERKPYLRSDSKKSSTKKELNSPPLITETLNNNKVNLAVKNLSSPLKNCDVKKILQEQLRIEKLIEQEKNDFELARKMEAEWNNRRHPRRSTIKRQVTLNYALKPAKKLKKLKV